MCGYLQRAEQFLKRPQINAIGNLVVADPRFEPIPSGLKLLYPRFERFYIIGCG
ncbi:MAG: hypothetical protein ACR2RL_21585 [Gammaproteobacteria bacterium]